jgi:hypothetical protein
VVKSVARTDREPRPVQTTSVRASVHEAKPDVARARRGARRVCQSRRKPDVARARRGARRVCQSRRVLGHALGTQDPDRVHMVGHRLRPGTRHQLWRGSA